MGSPVANLKHECHYRRTDGEDPKRSHPRRTDEVKAGRCARPKKTVATQPIVTMCRAIISQRGGHRGAFDSRVHITLAPRTKLESISIATTKAAYMRSIGSIITAPRYREAERVMSQI